MGTNREQIAGGKAMLVVVSEEIEGFDDPRRHAVQTLEQAFAQVCCKAGLNYHFEPEADCWLLVLTDGERPECSPEPIRSTFKKRSDAIQDLMGQAVDGRLKGWTAAPLADLLRMQAKRADLLAAE